MQRIKNSKISKNQTISVVIPDGFGFNLETLAGFVALIIGGAIAVLVGKNTKVEEQ